MDKKTELVLEAVKKLSGAIIQSHQDIQKLCPDVGSVRRVGPEIDRLIEMGAIEGGKIEVDGLTRFKYEVK